MKKLMIASAIAMSMTAGSAMAALGDAGSQGDVQFVATIAAKTCDVVIDGVGSANNLIQFGTLNKGEKSLKEFTVKVKDPACLTNLTKAHFSWTSPNLNSEGVANQSGTSTDSWVKLTPVTGGNTTTQTAAITSANNAVTFDIVQGKEAEGFKYSAELNAGQVAGSFETAAAYTVVYE
ncbi:TPA: hypothetical protein JLQ67_001731 [Escherichia coli]|nr:hypothetical protein [Escherichia coli]